MEGALRTLLSRREMSAIRFRVSSYTLETADGEGGNIEGMRKSLVNACAYRLATQQPRQRVLAPWGATRQALPPRRPLSPRG